MKKSHPLAAYLVKEGLSQVKFGAIIGRHGASVCHWINGSRVPTLAVAVAIERATKGAVPLDSWLHRRARRAA